MPLTGKVKVTTPGVGAGKEGDGDVVTIVKSLVEG